MVVAVVVLLLFSYMAIVPIANAAAYRYVSREYPGAMPLMEIAWNPVSLYCQHAEIPGSSWYVSYVIWCEERVTEIRLRNP